MYRLWQAGGDSWLGDRAGMPPLSRCAGQQEQEGAAGGVREGDREQVAQRPSGRHWEAVMRIQVFGIEIELRKETGEECRERVAREFRKKWGIPEKPDTPCPALRDLHQGGGGE